ncbi:hypothetical protein [Idiomarina zobellii]|uniref:Apea-like HEPN domain-containing protein n=1 Tax=Idiomarina zobellii TaxID=86103 RepID=A0A837NF32_9GAMM|nr:hypothetical protein [Idiomarina zobellii]KPD23678.1 hypothetical protein AFK76_07385 [Idiomarina zobellii]SDF87128.1 hypothetical protein SAMN04515658_1063 [Idiomarina zobellii]
MKAREWLQRSREAKDPIDGFSNAWRAFNHLYFRLNGQNERDKIRRYIEESVDEVVAERILEEHKGELGYLTAVPVIDMRGNGRDTAGNIEEFQREGAAVGKLQEIFMIIYQVRCNLEHGQKSPSRERDVELCRSTFPLIERIVDENA